MVILKVLTIISLGLAAQIVSVNANADRPLLIIENGNLVSFSADEKHSFMDNYCNTYANFVNKQGNKIRSLRVSADVLHCDVVTDYCNQIAIKSHQDHRKIAIDYKYAGSPYICSEAVEAED